MSTAENTMTAWPPYVDPESGAQLTLSRDLEGREVLQAASSDRRYDVVGGIPRILPAIDNYASAFGDQWLRWRQTQLDSFTGTTITRDRIRRCLGESLCDLLSTSHDPVHVLEVGCGAGRFTEILLQFPSVRLTSMDLSRAVEANALNFPHSDRHRVVQADLMNPPFRPCQYDVVICLGVVQHTPSPEATIAKLFDMVKAAGHLIIDHYTFNIRRWTKVSSLALRPLIKRLPPKARMATVERLVDVFFPIHRAVRHIPCGQQLLSRISPIATYFHCYPQLPDQLQKEWSVLDTHDGLTDWYKHLRSAGQIRKLLEDIGAEHIEVFNDGNGVEARCRRR